jgi:hypothetical protein
MKAKKLLLSGIFVVLGIVFCLCGIYLFNSLPDIDAIGYTNPKDSLRMTGTIFSFLFALGGFGGGIGFLISATLYEY